MRYNIKFIFSAVVVSAGLIIFIVSYNNVYSDIIYNSHEMETVINVKIETINEGVVPIKIDVYGEVSGMSNLIRIYSVSAESYISNIYVSAGQHVNSGNPLFESVKSPAASVVAERSTDLEREAIERLQQVVGRQADGLATRDELIKAEGARRRAEHKVEIMRISGQLSDRKKHLAIQSGVISSMPINIGTIIQPGNKVIGLVEDEFIGVQLWVEPDDVKSLSIDMPVQINTVSARSGLEGSGYILKINSQIDRVKRLVGVFVKLKRPESWLLGQAVRGEIDVKLVSGFIIPKESLVLSDGVFKIFIVNNSRARLYEVSILIDNGDYLLIRGEGISDGQSVITLGAYQVEDNILVEIKE